MPKEHEPQQEDLLVFLQDAFLNEATCTNLAFDSCQSLNSDYTTDFIVVVRT